MGESVKSLVSLLPVLIFLTGLVFMDSYKLVHFRSVVLAIVSGTVIALFSLLVNFWLIRVLSLDIGIFSKYFAPIIEETLKASCVAYLIKSKKVGFMVDAAIYGFAVGAGFALVENIYYLHAIESSNVVVWVIRGFGTAVMHGGTTAIFGIISKSLSDRKGSESVAYFLPGITLAIAIHSVFNHFVLPPVLSTIVLLGSLSLSITVVFDLSEKATRHWLGIGFDTDVELLEIIMNGKISETRLGQYLQSLTEHFPGEVVADMLCMMQIHLELAIRAKGILIMKKIGFDITPDSEIKAKLEELKYLEKSVGKTGKLAISPFLHTSSRDLWQLYQLNKVI